MKFEIPNSLEGAVAYARATSYDTRDFIKILSNAGFKIISVDK